MELKSEAEKCCLSLPHRRLEYELISDPMKIDDVGEVMMYGIRITETEEDGKRDSRKYENISDDREMVENLMREFEESGVDHTTAMDIILDVVN